MLPPMTTPLDPVALTQQLVQCPSVTPHEAGALALLERVLVPFGFQCYRVDRNGVPNLYARWGSKANVHTFGYNGHTDVVPIGYEQDWRFPPFAADIQAGWLYGRGSVDMKSSVAAFVSAAVSCVSAAQRTLQGAIVLTITGDEEGDATDGTIALMDWMQAQGESMAVCLVGEPSCREHLGDTIKIGRRGSFTAKITASGVQGHSAYPERSQNPILAMTNLIQTLSQGDFDQSTDYFAPSTLSVTNFDTGNTAHNVIPGHCSVIVNIRFNDSQNETLLLHWLRAHAERVTKETNVSFAIQGRTSAHSFITNPDAFANLLADAVYNSVGMRPDFSTAGGTSDARFIKDHCPVAEFGLVGKRLHAVDERASVEQIKTLADIYKCCLDMYFDRNDCFV